MADIMPSPRPGRAASVSSHGTTASMALSLQPRYVPRPDPQYISQIAAADRVTRLHLHDQFDMLSPSASPTNEGANFGENALNLLNSFLDALLYNFLGKARSTNLNKLRPAIREVLKAKLARDALAGADEEIQDLYEDLDAEIDEEAKSNGSLSPDWHLEETFKLMRLRVMVFLGLGDFDDEDEERFLEEEEFHINGERASPDMSILNGPTAVYLASVLEYLAERIIDLSGEAAYVRQKKKMSTRPISESHELEEFDVERVTVEETDVEKIALNPTFGRLWRTWRKQHRGLRSMPVTPVSASPRHARVRSEDGPFRSLRQINHNGQYGGGGDEGKKELSLDDIPGEDVPEHVLASNIPLPISDNDVDEIEVPGLAKEINDEDEEEQLEEDEGDRRARSAMYFHEPFPGVLTPHHEEEEEEADARPELGPRKRSLSAPHLSRPTFIVPPKELSVEEAQADTEEDDKEETTEEADDMAPEVTTKEPSAGFAGEEDEVFATPAEERDYNIEGEEKEQQGMVAGVLTGAAALVGSAVATVAGSKKRKDAEPAHQTVREIAQHAKKDQITATKESIPVQQPRSKRNDAPLSHEEAVAQEMGIPIKGVKPAEKPAEPQDDGPLTHEEAIAREMGIPPPKKATKTEVKPSPGPQKEVEPPAKVESVEEIPDLAVERDDKRNTPVNHGAVTQKDTSRKTSGQSTASMKTEDLAPVPPPRQQVRSMVDVHDVDDPEAIGVAKTSNIRIHSASPTPDQATYVHTVGQDRRNENFARPSSRDRNASFGGAVQQRPTPEDDYNISKHQQRQATPSPLREVATATGAAAVAGAAAVGAEKAQESLKERQTVAQNRDKPVPAVQQQAPQQGTSSTTTTSTVKRTSSKDKPSGERGAKMPPPLQTDFQDPASARPPSSNYSVRSSAASQTPHSARGSQSSIQPRALDKRTSDEARQRNFDDLVRGEETVKYTLTPDNLRDDPYNLSVHRASGSSQTGPPDRNGAVAPPPQVKRASPPRSTQRDGTTATQQAQTSASPTKKVIPRASEHRRSFASLAQRPQPMNTNARNGLMPREPRVVTDQMRDFADYLRSTAPANEQQATPATLAPGEIPRKPLPPSKPRTGNRMQARDPDVKGNTSSELIDFIRNGPPSAQSGEHRIPRTVAPFRTTMDSDDFKDYTPGSSNRASANGVSPSSTQGLISAPNGNRGSQPIVLAKQNLQPPAGGPVRKQRRVKDPYAIDPDDEDDTLTALPNGDNAGSGRRGIQIRKEESLADFLRNTEPPASNAPQPLINARPNGLINGASGANRPATQSSATSGGVPKKRFEARAAGATPTFQAREYYQTTNELAKFLGSSGPPEGGAPAPNVPSKGTSGGLRSGSGSKRGRQRGWLGFRGSRSVDD